MSKIHRVNKLQIAGLLYEIMNKSDVFIEQMGVDTNQEASLLNCLELYVFILKFNFRLHSVFGNIVIDGINLAETGIVRLVVDEKNIFPSLYEVFNI